MRSRAVIDDYVIVYCGGIENRGQLFGSVRVPSLARSGFMKTGLTSAMATSEGRVDRSRLSTWGRLVVVS